MKISDSQYRLQTQLLNEILYLGFLTKEWLIRKASTSTMNGSNMWQEQINWIYIKLNYVNFISLIEIWCDGFNNLNVKNCIRHSTKFKLTYKHWKILIK